jgi:hypothetical protein
MIELFVPALIFTSFTCYWTGAGNIFENTLSWYRFATHTSPLNLQYLTGSSSIPEECIPLEETHHPHRKISPDQAPFAHERSWWTGKPGPPVHRGKKAPICVRSLKNRLKTAPGPFSLMVIC